MSLRYRRDNETGDCIEIEDNGYIPSKNRYTLDWAEIDDPFWFNRAKGAGEYDLDEDYDEDDDGEDDDEDYDEDDDDDDDEDDEDDDEDEYDEDEYSEDEDDDDQSYMPVFSDSDSIEARYYDPDNANFRIGDAIYDNFEEIRKNFKPKECSDFCGLLKMVYRVDKALAISIWVWLLNNFESALKDCNTSIFFHQGHKISSSIFDSFMQIDAGSEDESEKEYILSFVSKHFDLEEKIFHMSFFGDSPPPIEEYAFFCMKHDLKENFLRAYNGILANPFRNDDLISKYNILERIIGECHYTYITLSNGWYHTFLKNEISSLHMPIKEAYLLQELRKCDCFDTTQNDTASKTVKAAPVIKEWDGKYYRYCKVKTDKFPDGLWYRTDDITIKSGDYVFVPLGKANEEVMATVLSAEVFRSDELPCPLEKTKTVCFKCDE